jgi:hypothetical protein
MLKIPRRVIVALPRLELILQIPQQFQVQPPSLTGLYKQQVIAAFAEILSPSELPMRKSTFLIAQATLFNAEKPINSGPLA